MPKHNETRHLPYAPELLFDLVADVGRYAEFLPWVAAVRVKSDSETEMIADLVVGFKGLHETFTSRVHKQRPDRVCVTEPPLQVRPSRLLAVANAVGVEVEGVDCTHQPDRADKRELAALDRRLVAHAELGPAVADIPRVP